MSFLRSVTNMALGYAAARGVDHFRKSGSSGGMKRKLQSPQTADQIGDMLGRFGISGGREKAHGLLSQFTGGDRQSGEGGTAVGDNAGLASAERLSGGVDTASSGQKEAGLAALLGAYGDRQSEQMVDKFAGKSEPSKEDEARAKLMLRAMIQAAKVDGKIDADEQAKIMDSVGSEASEEEIAFVREQMEKTVSAEDLAADTPPGDRDAVYIASLMAIDPEHSSEITYLRDLAQALGVKPADRDALHERVGAEKLPG